MTERFTKNYRILEIQPGTSWKQLRKAYQGLVNTWHPDRYQQNARQRKLAEEKTKEITQAYKELAGYYKKFGVLPLLTGFSENPQAEDVPPPITPEEHPVPESQMAPTVADAAPIKAFKRWPTKAITAAVLVAGVYFVWQFVPWQHPDNPSTTGEQASQVTDTQDESTDHRADKYFTIGSSLGEVYSIQGIPTKTEGDIWYYGKSKVYFVEGKVRRWEESPDSPLRVKIIPDQEKSGTGYFDVGSSKEEVLAAQGPPDRDAGDVWDYGVSRVYFNNGRVREWRETPFNPLKVHR